MIGWLAAALALTAGCLALHVGLLMEPASWRAWDGSLVPGSVVAALGILMVALAAHTGHVTPAEWATLPVRHRRLGVPTPDREFRMSLHRPAVYLTRLVSTATIVAVFGGQWTLRLLLWHREGGTRGFYFLR